METPFIRFNSFRDWPNSRNVSAISLTNAGFYCRDAETRTVECHCCDLTFNVSELRGVDPMIYHIRQSPDCIFAQQNTRRTLNQSVVAYETNHHSTLVTVEETAMMTNRVHNSPARQNRDRSNYNSPRYTARINITDPIDSTILIGNNRSSHTEYNSYIPNFPPNNPKFEEINDRLATFRYFDLENKPVLDDFAEAGFYFTGNAYSVLLS